MHSCMIHGIAFLFSTTDVNEVHSAKLNLNTHTCTRKKKDDRYLAKLQERGVTFRDFSCKLMITMSTDIEYKSSDINLHCKCVQGGFCYISVYTKKIEKKYRTQVDKICISMC